MIGVNQENLEVEDVVFEKNFMGIIIRNRVSNHRFWLINVYGPAQHSDSADFIQEHSSFCSSLTCVDGGRF